MIKAVIFDLDNTLLDFIKMKSLRKDLKLDWFINNSGDNCYMRGIFKKR